MQTTVTHRGLFTIVALIGDLDMKGYQAVAPLLHKVVQGRPRGLILDLGRLNYVASIGLSLMIQLAQESRTNLGEMRLANPQPRIQILLGHVHLNALIPVDDSVNESLKVLEQHQTAALAS